MAISPLYNLLQRIHRVNITLRKKNFKFRGKWKSEGEYSGFSTNRTSISLFNHCNNTVLGTCVIHVQNKFFSC